MLRLWRAVVLAGLALALLPACSRGGGGGYEVTAYFDKAVSLYEQSDVKILGLNAGTVREIAVEGTRVRVRMTIDRDQPLPADVKATIVPFSLIGERYVQLFPAWKPGMGKLAPGSVIPLERTTIPTEPDEALAALKKFLDGLDPNATGRLVHNLADDVRGNGQGINDALRGLADLTTTLAGKDAELVGIIEHFDRFSATLRTREQRLGQVMDQFSKATSLLAEERESVAKLVDSLSRVSADGVALITEHGGKLDKDLTTLTRVLQSIRANLDAVATLLDTGPTLVAGDDFEGTDDGLVAAWDQKYHHLDLRNATSPTLAQLLDTIGFPINQTDCVPIDVQCPSTAVPLGASMGSGGGMVAPLRSAATPPPPHPAASPTPPSLPELSIDVPASAPSSGPLDGLKRFMRDLLGAAW